MFRLWAKIWKNNHLLKDITIKNDQPTNRTKKVFGALQEACDAFDLAVPIWLDKNISEFRRVSKTRFYQDNFMEHIPFDYLEIHVIEEDDSLAYPDPCKRT